MSDTAAKTYTVDFANTTDTMWTFALYQKLRVPWELDSVIWMAQKVAPGAMTRVQWQDAPAVVVGQYADDRYAPLAVKATAAGKAWEIRPEGLQEAGEAAKPDEIAIRNQSGKRLSIGVGIDERPAVYQRNVFSGTRLQFPMRPTFFAALYYEIFEGMIAADPAVGPLELNFGSSETIKLTAWIENETLHFGVRDGEGGDVVTAPVTE